MNDTAARVLQKSEITRELKVTASALATSPAAEDVSLLQQHLGTTDFLDRLDPPAAINGAYTSLRLARVIKLLMDRQDAVSAAVLLKLITAAGYQASLLRMQLLVRALASIRPSPPEAIAYWDKLSAPGSPLAFDVIEAACINQSPPAVALLERKFSDPAHAPAAKVVWMRQILLPRRNDEPLLSCCERLLREKLQPELQGALVAALFDYQPEDWYRGCKHPEPPPRSKTTPAARQVVLRIARFASTELGLSEGRLGCVHAARAELGDKEKLG